MKAVVMVPSGPQGLSRNAEAFAFMTYYVYILKSMKVGTFYKGSSEQPLK